MWGLEVAVSILPRHHAQGSAPSCGTGALVLQTKKNIPLTSVRLCDPLSCPLCCLLPGLSGH